MRISDSAQRFYISKSLQISWPEEGVLKKSFFATSFMVEALFFYNIRKVFLKISSQFFGMICTPWDVWSHVPHDPKTNSIPYQIGNTINTRRYVFELIFLLSNEFFTFGAMLTWLQIWAILLWFKSYDFSSRFQ